MEKFAIISDPVKSDRIINALIKAGGKNTGHLTGEGSDYHMYYYIDSKGCINYEEHPKGYQITTIEEFEEKLFDVQI